MKKILFIFIMFAVTSCNVTVTHTAVKLDRVSDFKNGVIKDMTKSICENIWNCKYSPGDTIYRIIVDDGSRLIQLDITRYDYENYDLGDTIK